MERRGQTFLTGAIIAGLILGCILGEATFRLVAPESREAITGTFHFVGDTLFIGLLRMVLVPLVVSSVVTGVAGIGDPAHLGRLGVWTLAYYFSTMLVAVIIGVVLVTWVAPGQGLDAAFREERMASFQRPDGEPLHALEQTPGLGGAVGNLIRQLIPSNPLRSAVAGEMLPLISFSLLLGIALTLIGPPGRSLVALFESLFAAMMKMVDGILWLAPLGVLCLMAWTVGRIGLASLLGPLSLYILTVLLGLALHAFVVLPLLLYWLGRTGAFRFFSQMRQALLTALATSSSSATLPVTIECAERHGGVSRKAAGFVLPLGATINMDGTALYEAVAVVFLFQCFGIPLGPAELVIVALTATLAAVGAAGIPSAGLVTMVIVIEAVNGSLGLSGAERLPLSAVGIVLGVDRILDMCRTAVNVWGDAVGAKILSRLVSDT